MPAAKSISRRQISFVPREASPSWRSSPPGADSSRPAAAEGGVRLPLFTVLPYIQPGANSLLQDGKESMIVAWQTFAGAAEFSAWSSARPAAWRRRRRHRMRRGRRARVETPSSDSTGPPRPSGLTLGREILLPRPRQRARRWPEGYFTTRQPRGRPDPLRRVRRQLVRRHQRSRDRVSHLPAASRLRDELRRQRLRERYRRRVSACISFRSTTPISRGRAIGAPLLRSVPFYTVIANHDVQGKDEKRATRSPTSRGTPTPWRSTPRCTCR